MRLLNGFTRVITVVAVAALGSTARATTAETSAPRAPHQSGESPGAPFTAWVKVGAAFVRRGPDNSAPIVGLVRRGDRLQVVGCTPDCRPGGWALLEGPGALRSSWLQTTPVEQGAEPGKTLPEASPATQWPFVYGRAKWGVTVVRRHPSADAAVIGRHKAGQDLAFVRDAELLEQGWLRTLDGGYVASDRVRLLEPSGFSGVEKPTLPLAFAIKSAPLAGGGAEVKRYDRLQVLALGKDTVTTARGTLPRGAVRIAVKRPRPDGVPAGARWVHVDLREQVLVAYEGDTPVYATLVTTGRDGEKTRTRPGLFKVHYKTIHDTMSGDAEDPYVAQAVPFVLFFDKGRALHGTYWHDRFGSQRSHGCVNLAMADAAWLFGWAPPALPGGWRGIYGAGVPASLFVKIERFPSLKI
jgi:hypothetical protein